MTSGQTASRRQPWRTAAVVTTFAVSLAAILLLTPATDSAEYDLTFFLVSAGLGTGLGWDVLAATLAMAPFFLRARLQSASGQATIELADRWVAGNTATHTILPFLGIVLGVLIYQRGGPTLSWWLGSISVCLTLVSLQQHSNHRDGARLRSSLEWTSTGLALAVLGAWIGYPRAIGLIGFFMLARLLVPLTLAAAGLVADDEEEVDGLSFRVFLVVALDCIYSPLSKATQLVTWSWWEIGASSPIKGIIVGTMALIGTFSVMRFVNAIATKRTSDHSRNVRLARWISIGLAAEVLALGYFGWRALLNYFLELQLEWWQLLGTSAAVTTVSLTLLWSRLVAHQTALLEESLAKSLSSK